MQREKVDQNQELAKVKLGSVKAGPSFSIRVQSHRGHSIGFLIRWLALDGTRVSGSGLQHLERLPKLGQLFLHGSQLDDDGLEQLKGLTDLYEVTLSGTKVTDDGLKHLHEMPLLETVNLEDTAVSGKGVAELQKALPACRIAH